MSFTYPIYYSSKLTENDNVRLYQTTWETTRRKLPTANPATLHQNTFNLLKKCDERTNTIEQYYHFTREMSEKVGMSEGQRRKDTLDSFRSKRQQFETLRHTIEGDARLMQYQQQHYPQLMEILRRSINPDFPRLGVKQDEDEAVQALTYILGATKALKAFKSDFPQQSKPQQVEMLAQTQQQQQQQQQKLPQNKSDPRSSTVQPTASQPSTSTQQTKTNDPKLAYWQRKPYPGFFCLLVEAYEALLLYSNQSTQERTSTEQQRKYEALFSMNARHKGTTGRGTVCLLARLNEMNKYFIAEKLAEDKFSGHLKLFMRTLERIDMNVDAVRLEEGLGIVRDILFAEKERISRNKTLLTLEELNRYLQVCQPSMDFSLAEKIRAITSSELTKEHTDTLRINIKRSLQQFNEFATSHEVKRVRKAHNEGFVSV